jgi:cystathionine beta-synthase
LFLKLEHTGPTGSIKDRIAGPMIDAAERLHGRANTRILVEATSGNTGISLARICHAKDIRLVLFVPDKVSTEKRALIRRFGAEVRITRSEISADHPEFYQNAARNFAIRTGTLYLDQFSNPENARAHEENTGPEIWDQMEHRLDAIVCGIGSGGTLTGLSRYFRRHAPEMQIIVGDPAGSAFSDYLTLGRPVRSRSYLLEGIGGQVMPSLADLSRVAEILSIPDHESYSTALRVLRLARISVGPSTGCLVAAAIRYCRRQEKPKRIVTFACDDGSRYESTLFNDAWIATHLGDTGTHSPEQRPSHLAMPFPSESEAA